MHESTVRPSKYPATPRQFMVTGLGRDAPTDIITNDTITARLDQHAYSPLLRQADLPATPVPWWGDRTLHYEFA